MKPQRLGNVSIPDEELVKDKKEWFEKQGYMFGPGLKSEVTDDFSWD